MTIDVALTWMMFIGLFPITFFWLRRAWQIGMRKNYSFVALKRGRPPEHPERYAPVAFAINLSAGLVLSVTIFLILLVGLAYETWTAVAGTTIWMKLIAEFILSRQAHMNLKKR